MQQKFLHVGYCALRRENVVGILVGFLFLDQYVYDLNLKTLLRKSQTVMVWFSCLQHTATA